MACGAMVWLAITPAVSVPEARQSRPETTIIELLDSYEAGRYDAVDLSLATQPKTPLVSALRRHGNRWIETGPAETLDRRRLVASVLALEIVDAGLEAEWMHVQDAIEWACAHVRRVGRGSDLAQLWHVSSVALFHGGGGGYNMPLEHRHHLMNQPSHPRLRLALTIDDERRFGRPLLTAFGGAGGTSMPLIEINRTIVLPLRQQYESLVRVSDVGDDARLRLGHLLYRLGRIDEAMPHVLSAASSGDPFIVHIAEFLTAQVHRARGRNTEAAAAYRRALTAMPEATSASLALSVILAEGGDLDGSALAVSAVADSSTPVDPWRVFALGDYRWWPQWRSDLREGLRR